MIQIGNDKIKDIYIGSDKIKEVYYGSEKVWGGEVEPIQEGYWVHKTTGVKTYFGLEDSSIVDGVMRSPSWRNYCSEVQVPTGVTAIGVECFYYCTSLASITLPESITSIWDGCFDSCTSLTSITLPASVTSLGAYCFYDCKALTSITIPEGVTVIGGGCFIGCSSLTLATVLPSTPPSLGTNVFNFVHAEFNIKVRSPYVNAYKTATNWVAYAAKISAI